MVVHYHTNRDGADETLRAIERLGQRGESLQADVGDAADIHALFERVRVAWPALDACVWAVGTTVNRLAVRLAPEEWERVVRVNLTGLFLCVQRAVRLFPEGRGGAATVVGSLSGATGGAGQTAYAACKAGALGFVKSAARELGSANVRVNAVFPGWQPSPLAGSAFPERAAAVPERDALVPERDAAVPERDALVPECGAAVSERDTLRDHVLGRTPSIDEVADLIYRLTTARDISGQVYNLDNRIW